MDDSFQLYVLTMERHCCIMLDSQQQVFLQHGPVHCRYYGLRPDIKVISPWREWDLTSRSTLIQYAESRGIEVPSSKRGEPPFSMDANLLHISYEGCFAVSPASS